MNASEQRRIVSCKHGLIAHDPHPTCDRCGARVERRGPVADFEPVDLDPAAYFTTALGDQSDRCAAHGDLRCGACLYRWAVAVGRDDLARDLVVAGRYRGPRGGGGSMTGLAAVKSVWRARERWLAERSRRPDLSDAQWDLLLRVARANEAHDEPPRIEGSMRGTVDVLVRLGLVEVGGRDVTDEGWFYVRDEISGGRRSPTPASKPSSSCSACDRHCLCHAFASSSGSKVT